MQQRRQNANRQRLMPLVELNNSVQVVSAVNNTLISNVISLVYVPGARILRITPTDLSEPTSWFYNFSGPKDLIQFGGILSTIVHAVTNKYNYQTQMTNKFGDILRVKYKADDEKLILYEEQTKQAVIITTMPAIIEFSNMAIYAIDIIKQYALGGSRRTYNTETSNRQQQTVQQATQTSPPVELDFADEVLTQYSPQPKQPQNPIVKVDEPLLDETTINKLVEDVDDFLS